MIPIIPRAGAVKLVAALLLPVAVPVALVLIVIVAVAKKLAQACWVTRGMVVVPAVELDP